VRIDAVAIVIAIAAVLVAGTVLLDEPARIDHLTVANPTPYDVSVAVAPDAGGSWLPFAAVDVGTTREFRDVLDQGDTWVFRFRAQGQAAGDLSVSRADLAAAGWEITVPKAVVTQLRQLDVPPSPCTSTECPAPTG
jgi:hypothetical protein